jgi:hypothetical protein
MIADQLVTHIIPDVEHDAATFVAKQQLEAEWESAFDLIPDFFRSVERASLCLSTSIDDEEPAERLSLRLASPMPARDFMEATARFFAAVRKKAPRLYPVLVVRQD